MHATEVDYILTRRHRYDEMRSLYINQLAFILMDDSTTEATLIGVDEKINSFYEGDLEHATEVLSALWEIMNKDGDIAAPSSTPSAVSRLPFTSSLSLYGSPYHFTYLGHCHSGHKSRPLGLYENRPHRVNSQRDPVRQEVLG